MQLVRAWCPLLLLVAAGVSGCNNPETWRFREEVVLNTSESITVDRAALRNNVWPRMGNGGYQSVVNQWLLIPDRGVRWEEKQYGGSPISIGRIDGNMYVASEVTGTSDVYYCQSHPDFYAVKFWKQAAGGGWDSVEQSDALLDQLTANLLDQLEWGDDPSAKVPLLTLQEKSRRAKREFLPSLSVRQVLDKTSGASCRALLAMVHREPASGPRQSEDQR